MVASAAMLGTGFLLAALGPALLRAGWNGPRPAVVLGWASLLLAIVLTLNAGGAWGLAMGATIASAIALLILGYAALGTPAPANRRAVRLPPLRQPDRLRLGDLGRRCGIFFVVALLDLCAALACAWGCERLAHLAGANDANSLMTGLFALPLAWLLLASWQMTRAHILPMVLAAMITAIPGGLAWLTL